MANSLKDLLGSVDWGKLMSGSDARNTLVGSALGAALLGGAGYMQERDPEESKFAPVGDALMGALLGGVAGYGIPKGLSLFRDSGSLAPDDDSLRTDYLGWGLGGAAAGAAVPGVLLAMALRRAAGRLAKRTEEEDTWRHARKHAKGALRDARRTGAGQDMIDALRENRAVLSSKPGIAEDLLAGKRRAVLKTVFDRKRGTTPHAYRRLRELLDLRQTATLGRHTGWRGFKDLMEEAARESSVQDPSGSPNSLWEALKGTKGWIARNLTRMSHGKYYSPRAPWWTGKLFKLGPKRLALGRGGLYAAGGAGLAMLLHKWFGPSASNNYKD